MNLDQVATLPSRPIANTWYRFIQTAFFKSPLNYLYTKENWTRYSAGLVQAEPFSVVYLGDHPDVAALEVGAVFGDPLRPGGTIADPARSWVSLNVSVQLQSVVDLTDVSGVQKPLGTTAQELTGDWQGYTRRNMHTSVREPVGTAPTQELGAALFACKKFEGFIAISAKLATNRVLGVFPERMRNDSFLKYAFTDADGPHEFRIPPTTA